MKTNWIHKVIALFFGVSVGTALFAQENLPEFVLQNGHSGSVYSVAFSADGEILASGSDDNTVKLWEIASGRLLRTIEGHSDDVTSVAFSLDGKTLASGGEDNVVKLWEVASGRFLRIIEGHSNYVTSVAFSVDGKTLASGSLDNTVKLWGVTSGRLLHTLDGHSYNVNSVTFSSDGKTLASGRGDGVVKLWEVASGRLLRTIEGHSDDVRSVAFSVDGKTLASGSLDKTVKLWGVTSGRLLHTLYGHSYNVNSVAFSSDGKTLASGSQDKTVKLWEVASGRLLRTLDGHSSNVYSVAFSSDGKTLTSGGGDNVVKLWEVTSGRLLRTLEGSSNRVSSLALSASGKTLASGCKDFNRVMLWEIASGRLLRTLGEFEENGVWALAFSPDSKTLATGTKARKVILREVDSGRISRTLKADSDTVVIGGAAHIRSVAFSPDGKTLASTFHDRIITQRNNLLLWKIPSGSLLHTLEIGFSVSSVAFSTDGKILASGNEDFTKLWEVSSGRLLRTLEGHSHWVESVTFSSDGKILASGSADKAMKLWEVTSGRLLRTLDGHSDFVNSVAFSTDGKILASGSSDNTVKLWDVVSGRLLRTLIGHSDNITSVAFLVDGKTLVSGSDDTSIRFWRVEDGKLLAVSHAFDTGDYITYTPEGYYVASKGGEKFASWRIDNKIYSFEQYSERFNRPDIVATILAGGIPPSSDIRLAVNLPPELVWVNQFAQIQENRVEIILQYKGTSPLKEFDFVHNNKPVAIPSAQIPKGKQQTEIRVPLLLATSENTFLVRVRDEKDLKSDWVEGNFEYTLGAKGTKNIKESASTTTTLGNYGKKYAIIIGISDYLNLPKTSKKEGDLVDLKYAANDALAFKRFLENANLSGGQWEIHFFIDDSATTTKVDAALTDILTRANARDLIFIFFSGHGRSHPAREKDVYLLTHDFRLGDYRSGYSYSLLRDLISDTRAEHVLAFIDACRSGTIGFSSKGDQTQVPLSQKILGERLAQTPANRVIFTSGRGIQLSWEDETFKKSVFTHFLIKGLEGAAPEHKNPQFIDLGELADYVTKQVSEYTKTHPKMVSQIPMLWEKSGVTYEDFPMAIRKKN